MKELEVWLKSIADGLKVMAEGIHTVAKMVEDMANAQAPKKPKKAKPAQVGKTKSAPKKVAKKVDDLSKAQVPGKPANAKLTRTRKAKPASTKPAKKLKPKGTGPLPATDQVLSVLKKSKTGVDNEKIAKQTGLDKKQVSNVIFRLKKSGKVKSVRRGVYKVA